MPSNRNATTWLGRSDGSSTSSERLAVLDRDVACRRRAARSRAARRSSGAVSTRRAARGITPSDFTPLPPMHHRRPGLHDPERAVLAEVAALVLPVVRGRVEHAEVGRGGRVEELRGLLERERVGVVRRGAGAGWPARRRGRRTCRSTGRRAGCGPSWLDLDEVAVVGALEGDPAVGGERLVAVVAAGEHHVDDGLERRVEQHLERPIGRLPVLVGDLVAAGSRWRWSRAARSQVGRLRPVVAGSRARYPVSFAGWPRGPSGPDLARPIRKKLFCCARLRPARRHHAALARDRRRGRDPRPHRRPRSRRCCAASTSRSGRRTSTPATT